MSSDIEYRLGELFCGPGGLAWGAINADVPGMKIVHKWANDFDEDTCVTYRNNICPDAPGSVYCCDVRDLDITKLGDIDAFCYGFPCNSFSNVGEHKGFANEKFGQLYWYGVEVIRHYHPKWFIAENVSGIRSAGSNDFQVILNDLRESGYRLTVNLYKSELYGIPQTRHRVIIVGIREDLPVVFRVPDPAQYADADITARTALAGIPDDASNNEQRKIQKKEISQIYRKLDPEKPAYTVTAAGGGGTFMYHWTDRELTNRERARIQTFPDSFEFFGDYASVRKQIGMAVPCRLSNIVVTAVLNSFAGIEYPWVEENLRE